MNVKTMRTITKKIAIEQFLMMSIHHHGPTAITEYWKLVRAGWRRCKQDGTPYEIAMPRDFITFYHFDRIMFETFRFLDWYNEFLLKDTQQHDWIFCVNFSYKQRPILPEIEL